MDIQFNKSLKDSNLTDKQFMLQMIEELSETEINIIGYCLQNFICNEMFCWSNKDYFSNIVDKKYADNNYKKYSIEDLKSMISYFTDNEWETRIYGEYRWTGDSVKNSSKDNTIKNAFLIPVFIDTYTDYSKFNLNDLKNGTLDELFSQENIDAYNNLLEKYFTGDINRNILGAVSEKIFIRMFDYYYDKEALENYKMPEHISKYILDMVDTRDNSYDFRSKIGSYIYLYKYQRLEILKHLTVSSEFYIENIDKYGCLYKLLKIRNKELNDTAVKLAQQCIHQDDGIIEHIKKSRNISAKEVLDKLSLDVLYQVGDSIDHLCWSKISSNSNDVITKILKEYENVTASEDYDGKYDEVIKHVLGYSYYVSEELKKKIGKRMYVASLKKEINAFMRANSSSSLSLSSGYRSYLSDSEEEEIIKELFPENTDKELLYLFDIKRNTWKSDKQKAFRMFTTFSKIDTSHYKITFNPDAELPMLNFDFSTLLYLYMENKCTITDCDCDKIFLRLCRIDTDHFSQKLCYVLDAMKGRDCNE